MMSYFAKFALATLLLPCGAVRAAPSRELVSPAKLIITPSSDGTHSLVAKLRNVSRIPLCFAEDLVTNPNTLEPIIKLRRNGQQVRDAPVGYLPPVKPGTVTLKPGDYKIFRLNVMGRFDYSLEKSLSRGKWQVMVSFRVWPCNATTIGEAYVIATRWVRF